MHERTERAIARLLFVFCCAVPTGFVLALILFSWTPWYQTRQLRNICYQLGRETGLVFQMESCDRIAPNTYELNQVRLTDPDSGRLIATIRSIDFYSDETWTGIVLHQPEIQSTGLGVAWSKLHDRLISCPQHTMVPTSISANDLTISSPTRSISFGVNASIKPEQHGVLMTIDANDTSAYNESRLRVSLLRDRNVIRDGQPGLPETEVTITTDQTSLPCGVLAEYWPRAKSLGDQAMFSGSIRCRQSPEGWRFDFGSSTLSQVDLTQVSESLLYPIRGKSNIRITRGNILPGQSVSIAGTIVADEVTIPVSLLQTFQQRLGMQIEIAPGAAINHYVACELAMHFDIQDASVRLTGKCHGAKPGIALRSRGLLDVITANANLIPSEVVASLQPVPRSLPAWNEVFLPSPAKASVNSTPTVRIGSLAPASGGPAIGSPLPDHETTDKR